MKIKLSPVRTNERLIASVSGDVLTVNGVALDFSPLQAGETLSGDAVTTPWIQGDVSRIEGEISLTLVLPHGVNAPVETRFPDAFTNPITIVNGAVPLPPYDS